MSLRILLAAVAAVFFGAVLRSGDALGAGARVQTLEVSVIHATRTDGGGSMDPQLRDLPQLTQQQPFVRYNVFRLVDRKQLPCEKGKPVVFGLVDGRTLQVTLVDVIERKNDQRYHLRAEIAGAGKKEFLKLLEVTAGPNEPFFVAGQSYQGGTLFLELVVRG
ncbi:MAG: hypothetical protein M3O46_16220 [Myxococcota bacterium]|nr:hypothetical protein [Myxococcota bacterium]